MDSKSVAETFITKFEIKGNYVYAKVDWANNENDLFCIQIFSDNQSWSGNFSHELARTFQERLHENILEYSGNVKDALKRNADTFLFDFKPLETNPFESKFCWKRTFADSTAVLLHGSVTLRLDVPTESKDKIIDYSLNENKKLQSKMEDLQTKNDSLNNELAQYKSNFEKFVEAKESVESKLYGCFIELINNKKKKTKLLENYITTLENIIQDK